MGELSSWSGGVPDRPSRRSIKKIIDEAKILGVELDADAALWARGMELVTDLDHYRHTLAQGDPALNAVLVRFELGFAASAERTIRKRGGI